MGTENVYMRQPSSCSNIEMEMENLQNGNSQTQHSNHSDPHLQSFEPTASHDDFLEQMLSTLPNCSWPELSSSSNPNPNPNPLHQSVKSQDESADDARPGSDHPVSFPSFDDLSSKLRHHVNGNSSSSMAAAKSFLLQQQLLLSRGVGPPSAPGGDSGLLPLPLSLAEGGSLDSRLLDMVAEGPSFKSIPQGVDGSIQALYNGFPGPLHGNGQTSSQQPFQQAGAMPGQNFGGPGPAMNQAPASASTGGSGQAPQRQRVRARRGQATDPHSIAERLRRERIAERMKALQELVPNANKTDKASMLDEIIDYVKFLQLQVKVLSMSRLGGAGAVNPLAADRPSEGGVGRSSNNGNPAVGTSSDNMSVTEHQVVKLMEEDMGSAMQYLQGKGLCLMPISLATAISTATTRNNGSLHSNNHHRHQPPPLNNPILPPSNGNGNGGGEGRPSSPSLSGLTVQSANGSVKDSNPASKP